MELRAGTSLSSGTLEKSQNLGYGGLGDENMPQLAGSHYFSMALMDTGIWGSATTGNQAHDG